MSYSNDGSGRKRARVSSPVREVNVGDYYEELINQFTKESGGPNVKNKLMRLVEILEGDLLTRQDVIFNVFIRCVKAHPNNISVCSSIIAIININMYNQCGEFVDMVIKDFKACILKQQLTNARSLLNFICDLVNPHVVMPSSLIQLFNTILSTTNPSNPHQDNHKLYSDWLVGSVMCGLCYAGKELSNKRPEQLTSLINILDQFIRSRDKECVEVLSVWKNADNQHDEELRMWWEGLKQLQKQAWEEGVVPRLYLHVEDLWRKDSLPHTISPLTLPPPPPILHHTPEDCIYLPTRLYPLPTPEFHIFEPSDLPPKLPQLPLTNSIERFFVNETINSVILFHQLERKMCAKALLSLEFRCKVPLHYLIIEGIFRHMLRVGGSWDEVISGASILIELCKEQPDSVSQVLAQATVNLYDRLGTMNSHCVDRLSRWFAIHLNNFQFKWGWDDWMDAVKLQPLHPCFRFVSNTLSYCLRLSYHERVVKIVPDQMAPLLPPVPTPIFKYQGVTDSPAGKLSGELMKLFTSRSPVSQVSALIQESTVPMLERVDVFVQTLLHASSRVITFTLNALSRYTDVLKEVAQTDKEQDRQTDKRQESLERQVQVLLSLHSFWINKPQMVELLTDKLLKSGVVTWKAIVTWVFSDVMAPFLPTAYMDRVLHTMLEHLYNRLKHRAVRLEQAKKRKRLSRDYSGYDEDEEEDDEDADVDEYDDDKQFRTEDDIDKEESRLNALAQNLRKAQCSVVKHLVERLSDLLPAGGPLPPLLHHRLITFLFKHCEYSCRNITYLSTSVFTADLEAPILTTFNHFVAIFS